MEKYLTKINEKIYQNHTFTDKINFLTFRFFKKKTKFSLRKPGIEPGPPPWEGGILTTELLTQITMRFEQEVLKTQNSFINISI